MVAFVGQDFKFMRQKFLDDVDPTDDRVESFLDEHLDDASYKKPKKAAKDRT